MKPHNKLYKFIVRPPVWFCVGIWVLTVIGIAGAISILMRNKGDQGWAIGVFGTALALFILSVYCGLTFSGLPERISKKNWFKRLTHDYAFRTFVFGMLSVVLNIAYTVIGFIVAAITQSYWLFALVGYHVFLTTARGVIFLVVRKSRARNTASLMQLTYTFSGVALAVLAFALIPVVVMVANGDAAYYSMFGVYIFAIAIYSFYKLIHSLISVRRAKRTKNTAVRAIKNVALADAFISMFALQTAMCAQFGDDATLNYHMNIGIGCVVIASILAMGVYMIIKGSLDYMRAKNQVQKQEEVQDIDLTITDIGDDPIAFFTLAEVLRPASRKKAAKRANAKNTPNAIAAKSKSPHSNNSDIADSAPVSDSASLENSESSESLKSSETIDEKPQP